MKHPRDLALSARTRELQRALREPSGDFGRAGRSSWHYNISRPLGRKAVLSTFSMAWRVGSVANRAFCLQRKAFRYFRR